MVRLSVVVLRVPCSSERSADKEGSESDREVEKERHHASLRVPSAPIETSRLTYR
jgi:hypothetical protein